MSENAQDTIEGFLTCALDIGERMLISGGEVNRVEDTITRVCKAAGAKRVDVYTITSSIVVTMGMPDGQVITQTRRISRQKLDMNALDRLNDLSRYICQTKPSVAEVRSMLKQIEVLPQYSFGTQVVMYALVSGSCAMFFGGNGWDGLASALIGVLLKFVQTFLNKTCPSDFFTIILCSIFGGVMAHLFLRLGLGENPAMINLGNIMLLIPGIKLTNAIRDMIRGDTITGVLCFAEAVIVSMASAWGFAVITF